MTESTPAIRPATVSDLISSPQFVAQLQRALPNVGLTADRLARVVSTELRRNPKLASCTRDSLLGSVMICAQLGLEPGPMGLAYLIPYENKRAGTVECSFQLGYRGLLALLWRSDAIASIQSEVVYSGDLFDYDEGSSARVSFKRNLGDRGSPIAVFAAITVKGGGTIVRVMSAQEIQAHRSRYSKAGTGSPWDTAWDEMACKTILKKAAKRAPISTESQLAISRDDEAEYGPIVETTATQVPQAPAQDPVRETVKTRAAAARGRRRKETAEEEPPHPVEAQERAAEAPEALDPDQPLDSPQKTALEALESLGLKVRKAAVEHWSDSECSQAVDYSLSVQQKRKDPASPAPVIPRFVEVAVGNLLL